MKPPKRGDWPLRWAATHRRDTQELQWTCKQLKIVSLMKSKLELSLYASEFSLRQDVLCVPATHSHSGTMLHSWVMTKAVTAVRTLQFIRCRIHCGSLTGIPLRYVEPLLGGCHVYIIYFLFHGLFITFLHLFAMFFFRPLSFIPAASPSSSFLIPPPYSCFLHVFVPPLYLPFLLSTCVSLFLCLSSSLPCVFLSSPHYISLFSCLIYVPYFSYIFHFFLLCTFPSSWLLFFYLLSLYPSSFLPWCLFFVLDFYTPFFLPPISGSLPSFSKAFFLLFSSILSISFLPSLLASLSILLFYITTALTVPSGTAIHANETLRRKDPLENSPGWSN